MMRSAAGTTAATDDVDFALFLNRSPGDNRITNWQLGIQGGHLGMQAIDQCCRQHPRNQIALDCQCWVSIPPPDQWPILGIFDRRQLEQRNGTSVWNRNLQGAKCIRRYSLLFIGARDDIDQVYPVAQLRDGDAGHHG